MSLHKLAPEAFDYKTIRFLDWLVKEQGEEEKNSEDNVHMLKLFCVSIMELL